MPSQQSSTPPRNATAKASAASLDPAGDDFISGTLASLRGKDYSGSGFIASDALLIRDLDARTASVTANYVAATGELDVMRGSATVLSLTLPKHLTGNFMVSTYPDGGTAIALTGITSEDQADIASRSDLARSAYGVDGSGVAVGVISDSINVLGGLAQNVRNDELPASLLSSYSSSEDGSDRDDDEGRAMLQLVHEIAPGAQLSFQSDDEGLTQAIATLVQDHVKVIVDDDSEYDESLFSVDDPLNQEIAAATAQGIVFVTSAGNSGLSYPNRLQPLPPEHRHAASRQEARLGL